jgi:hypothetical protein
MPLRIAGETIKGGTGSDDVRDLARLDVCVAIRRNEPFLTSNVEKFLAVYVAVMQEYPHETFIAEAQRRPAAR